MLQLCKSLKLFNIQREKVYAWLSTSSRWIESMPLLINMTDVLQGHSDLSRQRSSSTLTSHVILGKKIHPTASIEMLAYIKNLADTWCIFNLAPGWEMWLNPGIITNLLGLNGSRSKEYNFFVVQLLKFVVSTAQSGIMQLLCASWSHTLVTHKLPFWRNSVAMEADGCGRDMKVMGS